MRIGELARATGMPVETLRYYEKLGLLPAPARGGNGYRRYHEGHAARLQFIRQCRLLDMSLDEVRRLLDLSVSAAGGCEPVQALLDEHLGHVDARIAALQSLRADLLALRAACQGGETAQDCGIVKDLAHPRPSKSRTAKGARRADPHPAGAH